jgi:hypothetical protein
MSVECCSRHSGLIRLLRPRRRVAPTLNARSHIYQIHKRAMESAFPFGGRPKVGFPAMVKQGRSGGKYRIKRETCLLQGDSPEKSNIQVCARSASKAIRKDI